MAENISQNLSGRQREIFLAIYNAIAENGFPPTVRELGEIVGLNSPSSVKYQLDSLEEAGFIARDRRRPRTIEITTLGQEYLQQQILPVDSVPTPKPASYNARSESSSKPHRVCKGSHNMQRRSRIRTHFAVPTYR